MHSVPYATCLGAVVQRRQLPDGVAEPRAARDVVDCQRGLGAGGLAQPPVVKMGDVEGQHPAAHGHICMAGNAGGQELEGFGNARAAGGFQAARPTRGPCTTSVHGCVGTGQSMHPWWMPRHLEEAPLPPKTPRSLATYLAAGCPGKARCASATYMQGRSTSCCSILNICREQRSTPLPPRSPGLTSLLPKEQTQSHMHYLRC